MGKKVGDEVSAELQDELTDAGGGGSLALGTDGFASCPSTLSVRIHVCGSAKSVSKHRPTRQRCSIARAGARKAQGAKGRWARQLPRHAERPHTRPGRYGQLEKTCKTISNTELTVDKRTCQTCVEPHTSEPLRLESQMDTSDTRAHVPGTTNKSRRSENTS